MKHSNQFWASAPELWQANPDIIEIWNSFY